jgi:hypothetical protein
LGVAGIGLGSANGFVKGTFFTITVPSVFLVMNVTEPWYMLASYGALSTKSTAAATNRPLATTAGRGMKSPSGSVGLPT